MESLASQIARLREQGMEIILVTSGAVGAGAEAMGMESAPDELQSRQALAAIGQSRLMHFYKGLFLEHGMRVAQILLTRNALDDRRLYLNARNTMETLLSWCVLPIVNENDTVAVEELKFGDNDRLSALIACKMGADLLVVLTDVDGLYDRPPSQPGAQRISYLPQGVETEYQLGEEPGSTFSLGGMQSKLEAVRVVSQSGIPAHIGSGRTENVLLRTLAGEDIGTWIEPRDRKLTGRKRWIAFGKRACGGRLIVDSGAEAALLVRGKSLLPTGIVEVEGEFGPGDLVQVIGPEGREVARGLVNFSSRDLRKITGLKTQEVLSLLGQRSGYEAIHRDNLVVLEEGGSNYE
jgi:glutamate 5-kinase